MATTQTNTQITQLYVALFGRAPDVEGRDFWGQKLESGTSLSAIVEQMYGTSPARGFYPDGLTSEQIIGQFYKNVLGRTADAEGLAFWTEKLSASNGNIGDVLSNIVNVVTHYEGTDPAGLASASLFGNRADLASAFSDALAQAGIDGNNAAVLNISRSILDAVNSSSNVNSVIADTVGKAVSLTQLAIDKPEVVAALIPAGGKLSDLMASMPAGSDFADLLDFSNKLAGSATDAAAIEKLIPAGGDLGDFLEKLPANTTPEQLIEAAGKGPDAVGAVGSGTENTGSGSGGGGGGGGGTPPATFTVTETGGAVTFSGTATGNISVAWAGAAGGSAATFTRGGVEATTKPDFSGTANKITVGAGQTLSDSAADLTGLTIDGTGAVAVTTATATTQYAFQEITASGGVSVAYSTGGTLHAATNLGTATVSIASGQTLTGTAAQLTGKAISGAGIVAVTTGTATTAYDFGDITASGGVSVAYTTGGTLSGTTDLGTATVSIASGQTLTGTATQLTGKTISGTGNVTITGLAADTNLANISASGTVTGTVTANVNLTAVDLTKLNTLTIASGTTATVTPQQYAVWKGSYDGTLASTDTTAPTVTITSAAYDEATNTLTLIGADFNTLLETGEDATTDIKGRLDWTKLVWKINGSSDVTFASTDIDSAKATANTTLAIKLTTNKATALEGASNYGGSDDTLVVTAGFARDLSDNVATTDGFSTDNTITVTAGTFTATVTSNAIVFGGTATGDITVTESSGELTFTRDGIAATPAVAITALADNTGIAALSGGDKLLMAEGVFDDIKAKLSDGAATISGGVTANQAAVTSHYAKIADGGVTAITYADDAAVQAAATAIADGAIAANAISITSGTITTAQATVLANIAKFKDNQVTGISLTDTQFKTLADVPANIAKLNDAAATVDATGATVAELLAISGAIAKVSNITNLANLDLGNGSITNTVVTNLFSKISGGAGVTVIATGAAEDEITTLVAAVVANKVGAQDGAISGDLAVTNANFSDANDVTALFGQYNGNTATVVVTDMDQGELNSLASDEAKIAANGITGNLAMAADNLNAGNIAKLFAKYGGTTATVNLGNSNLAKLTEVAGGIAKISAGGITGSTQFGPIDSTLSTGAITGLLGVAMNDSAAVYVNATAMDAAQLAAVGAGIGKVDNLTIDSTHGVTAAAADITGKTLSVTGAVATTDLLTVTGTGAADTINLGNVTLTTAAAVIQGGAEADNITLATGNNVVVFEATAAGNGIDTIARFNAGDLTSGGDILKVSDFLGGAPTALVDVVTDDGTGDQVVANRNILRVTDASDDLGADGIAALFGGSSKPFGAITTGDKYVLITNAGKIWFIDTALDSNNTNLTATDIVQVGIIGAVTLGDLIGDNFA